MLIPKKTKWRHMHKISHQGSAKGNNYVAFGDFGLQALEGHWITNNQIEAARISLSRYTKRGGKIWIRIFPHLSITKKPLEVRMGSGKGAHDKWVAVVKKGTILFEIAGVNQDIAKRALKLSSHKLPIATKIVAKGVK